MPKMIGYIKTFKVKKGDNKFMSFLIDEEKLLEKIKNYQFKRFTSL